jgi:hypothetical protein
VATRTTQSFYYLSIRLLPYLTTLSQLNSSGIFSVGCESVNDKLRMRKEAKISVIWLTSRPHPSSAEVKNEWSLPPLIHTSSVRGTQAQRQHIYFV